MHQSIVNPGSSRPPTLRHSGDLTTHSPQGARKSTYLLATSPCILYYGTVIGVSRLTFFVKKCLRNFRAVIRHLILFHKGNKKGQIFQSLRKKQVTNVTHYFYLKHVSLICNTKVYVCTTRNVFENGYKTYRYNLNISKVTYIQYIKQCIVISPK